MKSVNTLKKCISKLRNDNGDIISGNDAILEEEVKFYSNLYTSSINYGNNNNILEKTGITQDDIPKLSNEQATLFEGMITINECINAVKSMPNGKSPGSDGYPIEFYKMFWNQIWPILVKSFNYSFNMGLLSDSQRRSVISLIPKDGKDEDLLKNWRPISLLPQCGLQNCCQSDCK